MSDKTASEVIREARNVLFERHWHQGDYEGDDGSVCLEGALNLASTGTTNCSLLAATDSYWPSMRQALDEREARHWSLHRWNDAPERTFSEVIDVLDRAEKIAEAREVSHV